MSFFDSDYEYYGYSANLPLADTPDDLVDRQLQAAILKTAISDDRFASQGQEIVRTLLNPTSMNLDTAYYTRVRQNVDYMLKPTALLLNTTSGDSTISLQWEAFFSQLEGGKAVTLDFMSDTWAAITNFASELYAFKEYGWNTYNNVCSKPPMAGYTTLVSYHYDVTGQYTDYVFSNGSTTRSKRVPYNTLKQKFDKSTAVLPARKIFFGNYSVNDEPETGRRYFHYDLNNGVYPELADLPEPNRLPDSSNLFMPGVTLVANGVARDKDNFPEIYAHNKAYLDDLGLDYQQFIDEVAKSTDDDQVQDDVYITLGIDVVGTSKPEIHYLIEFWNWYRDTTGCHQTKAAYDAAYAGSATLLATSLTFRNRNSAALSAWYDPYFDAFAMMVQANYVERRVITASIGQINETEIEVFDNRGTQKKNGIKYSKDYVIYRRQINTTQVEEIEVGGPVYGRSISVGQSLENNKFVRWSLSDQEDDNSTFIVPICLDLVEQAPVEIRNYIGFYAMHLTVDGYQEVEVKWYQSDDFKAFMAFVAIVLAFYSAGQSLETFLALVEAYGVVGAVVIVVAVGEVIKIAVKEVIDFLAQALGEEFALIFAVIVAVVLAFYGQFSDNPLMSAEQLLYLSNGLLQGASSYNAEQLAKLQKKNERLQQEAEKLQDELEAAQKELDSGVTLDAWVLGRIDPLWIPGETPTEYFTRTVHSGNIGVVSIDSVSEFVNMKLQLPDMTKMNRKLGGLDGMV